MAGAVWYRARAQMRAAAGSALVLALLVGVACGVVMASAAGARRTDTAYPRMLEAGNSAEVLVSPNGEGGPDDFYEEVAALPGVRDGARMIGVGGISIVGESPEDVRQVEGAGQLGLDGKLGVALGRPNVIEGRMWRADHADETVVNRFFAERYDVAVGDQLSLDVHPSEEGPVVRLETTVVGITTSPEEVVPFTDLDATPALMFPPAVAELVSHDYAGYEGYVIDAAPGRDIAALLAEIDAVAARHADVMPDGVFTVDLSAAADEVQHSIRPLSVALALFALVLAAVVVVVVGQAIRRHVWLPAAEVESLDALGFRRSERRRVLALRGAALGVAAAAVAVLVAVAASPRFPIGPARLAEPDPGVSFDGVVLAVGVAAVIVFCVVVALSTGEQSRRAAADLVTPVSRWRLPPAASAGLRAAWPGRGDGGGGSAIAAAIGGLVAVLAAATFSASLDDLVDRPERYGQTWDRMVDGQFGPAPVGEVVDRFGDDPRVASIAVGDYGEVTIGDDRIPAVTWQAVTGALEPMLDDGRLAVADDEIALGGETLDRHGLEVGDSIEADAGAGPRTFRIVGRVVFPRLGLGSFAATGLGVGAQLHPDGMEPLAAVPPEVMDELPPLFFVDGRSYNFAAIDVSGGSAAVIDDELAEISAIGGEMFGEQFGIRTSQRPTRISDLDRVRSVPAVLAMALASLAAATLAHSLWTSLRARRRELAVMAALGFERRQLAATTFWQAGAVVVFAVLVALPVGAAAGRVAWRSFADEFYVPAQPVVPVLTLTATAVAALAVAALTALPAARRAGRIRPAAVLRTE